MTFFERIEVNPGVCHGQPCIKGTRIPVHIILGLLANNTSKEEILKAYPNLTIEDINACLKYAASVVEEEIIPFNPS